MSVSQRLDAVLPHSATQHPARQRIAIVRALPGLGDLLCAVPAFRALRLALPQAEISLIGLPWAQSFVDRFRCYLDAWIEFPGYPGIPEGWQEPQSIPPFLSWMQQHAFDLAIQMHGNGSYINAFTVLLGAKFTAGFYLPEQYCPNADRFLPYPDAEPEVWRHLRLMQHLGIPLQGDQLEFPILESDWQSFNTIPESHSLQPNRYVCVHPGASVGDRRWSILGFAAAADAMAQQGYQIVLTGTAAELELTQAVAQAMQFSSINMAGRTTLGALAILLQRSALLLCNDTGVSHLATALRTRSVVIFSNSELQRWAPLDRQRHRVVDLRDSTADGLSQVLAQVEALLQEGIYAVQ